MYCMDPPMDCDYIPQIDYSTIFFICLEIVCILFTVLCTCIVCKNVADILPLFPAHRELTLIYKHNTHIRALHVHCTSYTKTNLSLSNCQIYRVQLFLLQEGTSCVIQNTCFSTAMFTARKTLIF